MIGRPSSSTQVGGRCSETNGAGGCFARGDLDVVRDELHLARATARAARRTRAIAIRRASALARRRVDVARPRPAERRRARGTHLAYLDAGNPKGRRGIFVCQVQISGVLLPTPHFATRARRVFEVGSEVDTLRAT